MILQSLLSLPAVLAGESLSVTIMIYAVAKNNLGGQSQTPEIDATWSEP
jgi:hypothetical protein